MSHLEQVQGAFTRVCFDRVPSEEDLATLQDDRERWLLYRRMVRSRLAKTIRSGFPKTVALLGKPRFNLFIESYLADHGPTTRYIREVVFELLAHVTPTLGEDRALPAHTLELMRYEAAKWEVGALPWPESHAREFDFEAVPVFNPTLRVVEIRHRVDKDPTAPSALEGQHLLLVFRKPDRPTIFTQYLDDFGARLFRAWSDAQSCADGARAVLAAGSGVAEERFVDAMATVLASLIEDSVVLGSRSSAPQPLSEGT